MANKMQSYIKEQPAVLAKLVADKSEKMQTVIHALGDRPIRRLILIGSGSSNYAAGMAGAFMERILGIEVFPVTPTGINESGLLTQNDTIYIAISQSGVSTNTYSLVKRLKEKGKFVIGLTSNPISEIAGICDQIVDIGCGEEKTGPKTKGVTATALMLCIIGLEISKDRGILEMDDYNRYCLTLEKMAADIADNITCSKEWYEANYKEFLNEKFTAVIGAGPDYFAACEGTLKMLETLYRPVCAYEFEEFLHGPHCLIGSDLRMILLLPQNNDMLRMLRLKEYAQARGSTVYTISAQDGEPEGKNALHLRQVSERFLDPLVKIIPFQILSAYLSESAGNNIDQPRFSGFSATMGSKFN